MKRERYLADVDKRVIHDLEKAEAGCKINDINNKLYLSKDEVEIYTESRLGYNGCKLCLKKYHREGPRIRYLANSNTKEIHDLENEKDGCKISKISLINKVELSEIADVKYYIRMMGYNGCRWCLEKYHTD